MIHIIDDWYVDADDLQYISYKLRINKKKGTEHKTAHRYHATLEAAVTRILSERKRLMVSELACDIKTALQKISDYEKETRSILLGQLRL